jgi:glycosyltransferase involved in cell wall biosynthesis
LIINIIYYSFLIGSILQILYWGVLFGRLAFFKIKKTLPVTEQPPVSVIICAKNEATNLQKYLPSILKQNYLTFEVIVVNDNSSDDTEKILNQFKKQYNHLKIINLHSEERAVKGKKYALSKGINSAKYPNLLLTDADCEASSPEWITFMQSYQSNERNIGLGYGPMFRHSGWLNILTRLETTYTAIQYFSFALWKMPYMGVGRNLTYKKQVFDRVNGFQSHGHIASGDDDLFISEASKGQKINVILNEETFMYSEPKADLDSFLTQKGRHLSTSTHYRMIHKILLGGYSVSLFSLHVYFFILIMLQISVNLLLFLYLARLIIFWAVNYSIFKKLKVLDLWFALPLLDILYLIYLLGIFPALIFRNTSKWA